MVQQLSAKNLLVILDIPADEGDDVEKGEEDFTPLDYQPWSQEIPGRKLGEPCSPIIFTKPERDPPPRR